MKNTDLVDAKFLIEGGIDINTSDLTWEHIGNKGYKLTIGGMKNFTKNDFDLSPVSEQSQLPAWSTEALLDMLPKHIRVTAPHKVFLYSLVILPDSNNIVGYKDLEDKESESWLERANTGDMYENALVMVKWALRYHYIGVDQYQICKEAIS